MTDVWTWVIIGVVCCAIELATAQFFAIFFGLGAFAAALLAWLTGSSLPAETAVALSVAAVSVLVLRRPLQQRVSPPETPDNVAAYVGRSAMVTERVDNDAFTGQVRIGGEIWQARAAEDGHTYDVGTKLRVVRIDGVTALVAP